jgi:hypothetical protein
VIFVLNVIKLARSLKQPARRLPRTPLLGTSVNKG